MVDRNTLVGLDFLVIGSVVTALGFFLASSIPIASFGFALMIIGALVLLIVPEPLPKEGLKALLKDSIRNLEMILEESGIRNRAYFIQVEGGELRALVPLTQADGEPTPQGLKSLLGTPASRFVVNQNGVRGLLVVPPGNEIVKLAKIEKGADLEEALRSALVEYSEVARGVLVVEEDGGRVAKIQINKPQLSSDSPYFTDSLGTPVSCLACCVAAVAKGETVRILEERYDPAFIRLTIQTVGGS